MGSVEEEEREFIKSLVDKLFEPDISVVEKVGVSTQIKVRLKNVERDVILPQQQTTEIYGDPKKGVVTPLE